MYLFTDPLVFSILGEQAPAAARSGDALRAARHCSEARRNQLPGAGAARRRAPDAAAPGREHA